MLFHKGKSNLVYLITDNSVYHINGKPDYQIIDNSVYHINGKPDYQIIDNLVYHINGKPDYQITRLPDYHIISFLIIFVFVLILNFIISIAIYNNYQIVTIINLQIAFIFYF